MALVPDQKFSTFQDGGDVAVNDIIVGLRGGINTRFLYTGTLAPGTIIPIDQGGTGSNTASGARSNLGLGSMALQDASAVDITGGTAALTTGQVATAPSSSIDIANKSYVDGLISGTVASVGGTAGRITSTGGINPIIDIDATYAGQTSITILGTITTGTWTGTTIAIDHGGTGVTSVTTSPIASAWAGWDANKNFSANNLLLASTTYTAGLNNYTLTASSTAFQVVTGGTSASSDTFLLPDPATLENGYCIMFDNQGLGSLHILDYLTIGTITFVQAKQKLIITLINKTTPATGLWSIGYLTYLDVNSNLTANNIWPSRNTVTSANDTTILTVSSDGVQNVIGNLNQTIQLPDITTLQVAQSFVIANKTIGGIVTVTTSSGLVITNIPANAPNINFFYNGTAGNVVASWTVDNLITPSFTNTIQGYTTTATAGGTTTLIATSNAQQYFTGTLNQTVLMPVTSTLLHGQLWTIVNTSTGIITVQSSGGNTITTVAPLSSATITCILITGTTAASWIANGATNIQKVNSVTVTASTTYTPTAGMLYCIVEACGGGGGSGGTTGGVGTSSVSAGGGSGSWAKVLIPASSIGASQSITIGIAGTAGTTGGGTGGNGGTTTLGSIISCPGGVGGSGAGTTATFSNIGRGAGGSAPTLSITGIATAGTPGMNGFALSGASLLAIPGNGGDHIYGGAGAGAINANAVGGAGAGYGAGAGGSFSSTTNQAGNAGSAGIVYITEYIA